MKLISAHIENFGKLSNVDFDFDSSLNSFLHENGWGKTTFSVFIKSMLYGMEHSTKKNLDENELQKYAPWQGGVYGGNLVFEHDGKKFKISRTFGKKKSDDTFELIDLSTNKKMNEANGTVGERIYGVSRETYERSVHVILDKTPAGSSEISAKLTNLLENDDVGNFDTASDALETKASSIKAKRKTGTDLISRIQTKIDSDRANLDEINSLVFRNEQLEKKISELKIKEVELKSKQKEISEQFGVSAEFAEKKLSDKENAEYEKLANKFYGIEISKDRINSCISDISVLQESKIKLAELEKDKAKKEGDLKLLQLQKKNNPLRTAFFVVAALCLVTGLLGIALLNNLILGITGICAAVIFLAVSFFTKPIKIDTSKTENEISDFEKQVLNLKEIILQKEKTTSNFIHSIYPDRPCDTNTLSEINSNYDVFLRLKSKKDEFISWSATQGKEPDKSVDELKAEQNDVNSELYSVTSEKSRCEKELENNLSLTEKKEDIESEIENLSLKKKESEAEYEILVKTLELLSEAKEKIDANYSDPMKEGFEKYVKLLDSNLKLSIDTDLQVSVDSGARTFESDYLSAGYKDLVNFCSRMALIDAIYQNEKPAVILDDPFVNLDDDKVPLALELVKKLSEEKQILYFACHKSREI